MNDHDLGLALQRDADLVGAPAPDLLDQLRRRRQQQRRQRTGLVAAVLGVLVIAGGVPLGQSLLSAPDGRTAFDPTVTSPAPTGAPAPAPSAPVPSPAPSSPAASSSPQASSPQTSSSAPASSSSRSSSPRASSSAPASSAPASSPAAGGTPACPSAAALFALVPDQPATRPAQESASCSGDWALIGVLYPNSQGVELFRYVGGAWQPADDPALCGSGEVPAEFEQSVCSAG